MKLYISSVFFVMTLIFEYYSIRAPIGVHRENKANIKNKNHRRN